MKIEIAEQRYNSTYGFVRLNELESQATEIFGVNWEAEDDVSQIEQLLEYLGRKDLKVTFIEGLGEDDIEVSIKTNEFFETIDFDMLKKQKLNLLKAIESINVPSNYKEGFDGILHLIDGIQDYAKDSLGKDVF